MSYIRHLGIVVLLISLVAVSPTWAKKGDIVPEGKKGVKVIPTDNGPVAEVKTADYKVRLWVSTGKGVLTVQMKVWNNNDVLMGLRADSLVLSTSDGPVEALTPDQYIASISERKPYEIDKDGKILVDDKVVGPVKDSSTDDVGAKGEKKKNEYTISKGSKNERMTLTKELLSLRNDMLYAGGTVDPKENSHGRKVYQRNGLELPLTVTFQPRSPNGTMAESTVIFVRAK